MPCPYEGMVMERLLQKITDRTAHVAVIGLGYVGLPLAMGFAKAGYHVTGIDVDAGRVGRLKKGDSYIQDVPSSDLRPLVEAGRFNADRKSTRLNSSHLVISYAV